MNSSEWQHICEKAGIGNFTHALLISEQNDEQHWKVTTQQARFFTKTRLKSQRASFLTQKHTTEALLATNTLYTPRVIAHGQTQKTAWLVLEWLSLKRDGDWSMLGMQLAQLHQQTQISFGWFENNTVEQTLQFNQQLSDWVSFFRSQRLLPQLRLANERGLPHKLRDRIQDIMQHLESYFTGKAIIPSLVHGNLSSQTVGFLADGQPVVLSPACYYGDAETDMATSTSFPDTFHISYRIVHPMQHKQEIRHAIYQLYHHLIDFNQHGGQSVPMIERIIADILRSLNAE